jgi:hypothetical protein
MKDVIRYSEAFKVRLVEEGWPPGNTGASMKQAAGTGYADARHWGSG